MLKFGEHGHFVNNKIRAYGNDDIDNSIIQNDITHWMEIPKLLK